MSLVQEFDLASICERRAVSGGDVLAMRRAFFEDGHISPDETESLFEINQQCTIQDTSWRTFFVEALTDFVVHQSLPKGYVTVETAEWLIDRVSKRGRVETECEFELLLKVLETARWSPERLIQFTLEQVKHAVLEGAGPLSNGRLLRPGVVGEAEVELLRRALYAFGGDGHVAISRAEAEILFDINDKTVEALNHPSWSDLFAKAIANYLMASSGYTVPTRQEAMRREDWLQERSDTAGFLGEMVSGGLGAVWAAYQEQSSEERAIQRLEDQKRAIITAERITASEANWLVDRIGRDGILHENERALLEFIKQESPNIHPALTPLLEKIS